MVVTDIGLTENGWNFCLCGLGPQHCLTKFTAMSLRWRSGTSLDAAKAPSSSKCR
jgi:hypothetical protein